MRGITALVKGHLSGRVYVAPYVEQSGRQIRSLEDLTDIAESFLREDLRKGAVGFKIAVDDIHEPDAAKAAEELKEDLKPGHKPCVMPALRDYLFHKGFDVAAKAGVPVAVHTGYWGDFRTLDPKLMLNFVGSREDVRFDMFHLGAPMLRDAMVIGKNHPNVTLNLCWLPLISQVQLERSIDELIDMVPVNKITAFGGDYYCCVQKVWGALVMARECVASSLARRVDAGDFDQPYALYLAKLWFHDNPARIYKLPVA